MTGLESSMLTAILIGGGILLFFYSLIKTSFNEIENKAKTKRDLQEEEKNTTQRSFLKPKFCPNCGKELTQNDEMKFCDNCGEKL